jgi:hypothetical protein
MLLRFHYQGGYGFAERITFQDVSMHNVTNPIIIDQNYCDPKKPCHEQVLTPSRIQISLFVQMFCNSTFFSDEFYFVQCRYQVLLYVIYITETSMEPVLHKLPSVSSAVKRSVVMG